MSKSDPREEAHAAIVQVDIAMGRNSKLTG